MSGFVIAIEFILILSLLAFLHELGHFIPARLFKIEVEEFGLGFPPRLVKLFTWKGTEFTLNWIPFGAFVRPKGENDPNIPGGLASANPFARLVVLFGGPVMNLLVGALIFALLFAQTGMPVANIVNIMEIAPGSPAELAGMQKGDTLLAINGQAIDSTAKLSTLVQQNLGKEITLSLKRGEQTLEVKATPRVKPPEGQGALGIVMGNPSRSISYLEALPYGIEVTATQGMEMLRLPVRLIRGEIAGDQARLVSPVGLGEIYGQARERDQQDAAAGAPATSRNLRVIQLIAFISVALGITNLLPIPALDGGRILFVLFEIVLRRRVPAERENMVHAIGFTLLILLMSYVLIQDIINPIPNLIP